MNKRAKPAPLPGSKDSLLFFVYCAHRKCSEARMTQVKNGLTLAEVVKSQEKAFNSPTIRTRQNSVTYRDPLPKISPKLSLSQGVESPKEYYPIALAGASQPLSPAMEEYLQAGEFDKDIERKKHKQLKKYFFVTRIQEKYRIFSRLLSEDLLSTALSSPPPTHLSRLSVSKPKVPLRTALSHLKLPAFEFEDGITRVNEEVESIVNQKFEKKKQEEDQRRKLTQVQKMFADRMRNAERKRSLSPMVTNSTELSGGERRPEVVLEPMRVEVSERKKAGVHLPKYHSRGPMEMIRENQQISKALGQHFLKNVQQRRKMLQKSPSLASFFITNS